MANKETAKGFDANSANYHELEMCSEIRGKARKVSPYPRAVRG
jgi:hypothetical protein